MRKLFLLFSLPLLALTAHAQTYTVGATNLPSGTLWMLTSSRTAVPLTSGAAFAGIAQSAVSSGGSITVANSGTLNCLFENATTAGDLVIQGTTNPNQCRDAGTASAASVSAPTVIYGVVGASVSGNSLAAVTLFSSVEFGTYVPSTSGSGGSSIPVTNNILVGSGSANLASDSSVRLIYGALYSDLLLGVGFSTTLTGQADTVFGINAGASLTAPSAQPQNNTFIGYLAGNSATTARESTIIGAQAGQSIIGNGVGAEDCIDTFIGSYAGMSELCNLPASADGYDVYVGQKAGMNSTHGFDNVFLGVHTGTSCYGADCTQDVIIGQAAMNNAGANPPGIALTQSVIIGGGAFNGNTTGGTNTGDNFIGQFSGALAYNVSNSNCFGLYSCASLASGNGITAFGDHAAQNTTVGGGSFFGSGAGSQVTTGTNLSLFGNTAGLNITTGSDDSCFGNGACYYLAAANQSSVFGSQAGHIMTAQNDLFGYSAGSAITSGASNVAFGSQSLHANITSKGNTAVGYEAAHGTTAQGATSIGYEAGYSATSGAENTFIGYSAGFGVTTGQQNVIVGGDHVPSNPLTTGSNNEAIGWGAFLGAAVSGAVQIGSGTNSTSNTMQYQSFNFLTNAGAATFLSVTPSTLYSAAGTALPTCASSIKGQSATVSDASAPTSSSNGAYVSGGTITTHVTCSYNGSAYSWQQDDPAGAAAAAFAVTQQPNSAYVSLVDDFIGGSNNSGSSIGQLGWNYSSISGGASVGASAGTWNHPMLETISSIATSGEGTGFTLAATQPLFLGANAPWQSEWIAEISAISSASLRVGFANGSTSKIPNAGIYFRFDTSLSDTNWMACVANSGTETCTATSVAVAANTFYDFYISSTTAGTIVYQINATSAITLCSSGCTAAASIPSSALQPTALNVTLTNAALTTSIDYFSFYASGLSR